MEKTPHQSSSNNKKQTPVLILKALGYLIIFLLVLVLMFIIGVFIGYVLFGGEPIDDLFDLDMWATIIKVILN